MVEKKAERNVMLNASDANAPIRTKIITNTYIRETTLVQYELLSQTVLNS